MPRRPLRLLSIGRMGSPAQQALDVFLAALEPPPGGAYAVYYAPDNLLAHVRPQDLRAGVRVYARTTPHERENILARVVESLHDYALDPDEDAARITGGREPANRGRMSSRSTRNAADDVGIWWLYEILAGRGRAHLYVTPQGTRKA